MTDKTTSYTETELHEAMAREQCRMYDGTYKRLPNSIVCAMHEVGIEPEYKHFLHLSGTHSGHVAWSADDSKLVQDRQTSAKFGRYLSRNFPQLKTEQIAHLSALLRVELEPVKVQFARTREAIREVYENGPHSCMAYKAHTFDSYPVHPVEVYASGDCAVAYIERTDPASGNKRITARVVTNEVDKQFSCMYGDAHALESGLIALGYTDGDIEGCKLLRLENDNGAVVMPYLDGADQVSDCGDYMRVGYGGEHYASNTNGLLCEEEIAQCDDCGAAIYDEDDLYYDRYGNPICRSCIDYHYAYSEDADCYVHENDDDFTWLPSGDVVRNENVEDYGYCFTHDGILADKEDCVYSDFDGEWYNTDDVVWCELDGHYAHTDDVKEYETTDGETRYTTSDPLDDEDNAEHSDDEEDAA